MMHGIGCERVGVGFFGERDAQFCRAVRCGGDGCAPMSLGSSREASLHEAWDPGAKGTTGE